MDTLPPHADSSNIPLKRCPTCPEDDQWHPATADFWHRKSDNKSGFTTRCKNCLCKTTQRRTSSDVVPEGYKRCPTCPPEQQLHPATSEFFNYKHDCKYGLNPRCKQCLKAQRRDPEWREHKQVYDRSYRSRPGFQEHRCIAQKAYWSDPEKYAKKIAYERAYNSRPDIQERRKTYRSQPEIMERRRFYENNRRARKKASMGTFTHEQVQEQLKRQKYRCYYAKCDHAKFEKKDGKYIFDVEHIVPLSRGGSNDINNIVLACPSCNGSKHDKLPCDWPEGGRLL